MNRFLHLNFIALILLALSGVLLLFGASIHLTGPLILSALAIPAVPDIRMSIEDHLERRRRPHRS